MPTDKLFPAYTVIDYHSAFGVHQMTRPTKEVFSSGLGDAGTYEAWDASTVVATDMIEALVDLLAAAVPNTITFDAYTIYRVPTVGAAPQPIFTKPYVVVGSAAGLTGQAKAVQVSVGFKTDGFGDAKIVVLDTPVNGSFGSFTDPGAAYQDVIDEFTRSDMAWAGRDNFRPSAFTNVSISLNKRLRRKYGMI